jgi:hypothetical protein
MSEATPAPDPLEAFTLRCWARARLYRDGEIDLHDAVDQLQAAAVDYGLVERIGQDAVQQIVASAFAGVRYFPGPGIEPEPVTVRGVARSTLVAAAYVVSQGDPTRLERWLDEHSATEREAIFTYIAARRRRDVA